MQGTVRYSEEFIKPDGCKAWFGHEKQYDQDTQDPPFEEVVRTVMNEVKKRSDNYSVIGSSRPLIDERDVLPEIHVEKDLTEENRMLTLISDIESCTDLKVLETYGWMAANFKEKKGDTRLSSAYERKYDQLTQKQ